MEGHVVRPMSARQRDVMRFIVRYYVLVGEPPPMRCISRRMGIRLSAVQQHLLALHEKGWLTTPTPDGLRCVHHEDEGAPAA
jgi:hypothetical protein